MRSLRVSIGIALLILATASLAQQEQKPPHDGVPQPSAPRAPAQKAAPQPPAAAPTPLPAMPVSPEQALYLIRSALLTLNDANRSGNYTVLRDLASLDFQARNTNADLSDSFADLRRRHFDLFSVALAAPQLSAAPALDANGMLRLTGLFPTRPLQINFDLLFQNAGGQWRLFGISVGTPQVPAQPQPASQAPSPAPIAPRNTPAQQKK